MLVDEFDELPQGVVHVFGAVEELKHFHEFFSQRETFKVAVHVDFRKGKDGKTLGQSQHHGLYILTAGDPNIVEGSAVFFVKIGAAVFVILFIHGFGNQGEALNRLLDGTEVAYRVRRKNQVVQGLQNVNAADFRPRFKSREWSCFRAATRLA